ncbi:MAG: GNAT family N-acetyltransferase [Ruminococcus sp.]|nr:GNAT family N-acetyltransferase [Ruminococcus sp.]
MIELRLSRESDVNSLKKLYRSCFEEKEEALELFFERIYKPEICYVVEDGGQIVSMLYFLNTTVNGRRAGYIYAAATKEEFRGTGLMSGLVNFAMATTGAELCVTLPAEDSLYDYYQRLGFKPLKINFAEINRAELERLATPYEEQEAFISGYCGIRNRVLKDNFLFWNNNHIDYAFDYYALYGAKIIKNNFGYLIALEENGVCEVLEIICADRNAGFLINDLLKRTEAESFIFRLSPKQKFILSEEKRFAMVKYKTDFRPECIFSGLTLD